MRSRIGGRLHGGEQRRAEDSRPAEERERVLRTGLASGLIANDDAGNRSCYVVERMCLNPGAAIGSNCNLALGSVRRRSRDRALHRIDRPGDAFYRVTVRVEGPRNTVTYAQAMLK